MPNLVTVREISEHRLVHITVGVRHESDATHEPNSSIKWVLKQKGADNDRLKEVLGLNPNEVDLISSLGQERGSYSEAFLMAEDSRAVVIIESTPLEYWLATTDGRDLGRIEDYKKQYSEISQLEILKKLAFEFPRGVAAHKEIRSHS